MTLMVPSFSVGSSTTGGNEIGKTLDEMIEDRRKEQVKASKRGQRKASNADRTIATGRAKREAANKARRGLSQDKKTNAMEIEREVYRQTRKTQNAKKRSEIRTASGRIAPDSSLRSRKRKAEKGSVAVFGGRSPPKKAVEAALKGMQDAGFTVPTGHQLVMTFIPVPIAEQTPEKDGTRRSTARSASQKNKDSGNNKKGDGRRKRK